MRLSSFGTCAWLCLLLAQPRALRAQDAGFISLFEGATNISATAAIEWAPVAGTEAYYLYVGTKPGAMDLCDSGEIQLTSFRCPTLPAGRQLHARLNYSQNAMWHRIDVAFTTQRAAALTLDSSGGVDLSQPLRWTEVAGATSYRLVIGKWPGGTELLDSGEISATSYQIDDLALDQPLHARLYTKLTERTAYTDATFTAPRLAQRPRFLQLPDGASDVPVTKPFVWNSVDGVEAYYLYVGTTRGAKDVCDSSELQATWFRCPTLPAAQTLHARLNLKRDGGVWQDIDVSFTTARMAGFVYPRDASSIVDLNQPFRWTAVPGATSYSLRIGSAPGRSDVLNTGEITRTSHIVKGLPTDRQLYARVYTQTPGGRRYSDVSFTLPARATFIYPADRAAAVDLSRPLEWAPVPGAIYYYLIIGTDPGGRNLVETGQMTQATFDVLSPGGATARRLPSGRWLHARISTLKPGLGWLSQDITFQVAATTATFVAPRDGQLAVNPRLPFRWTPVADPAATYQLSIGTVPGGTDLVSTPALRATTYQAPGLPAGRALYARLVTTRGSLRRNDDVAFMVSGTATPPRMLAPNDGTSDFDPDTPFQWTDDALSRGYRLRIGTAAGGSDVHDSSVVRVSQRFVETLPAGVPLFGRIEALIDGTWVGTDFTFTAGVARRTMARKIQAALWATNRVRQMADFRHLPFIWTELAEVSIRPDAFCTDYAVTLVSVLNQMNVGPARLLVITFNNNQADTHALVELLDADTGRWMLLDPTFNLAPKRRDGAWATAEEVQSATRAARWDDIVYEFLGPPGEDAVRSYNIDYPLLYLNVYHRGETAPLGQGASVMPYLQEVAFPVNAGGGLYYYVVQCLKGAVVTLRIDGVDRPTQCLGVDSTSRIFLAESITGAAVGVVKLYRPIRPVFPPTWMPAVPALFASSAWHSGR